MENNWMIDVLMIGMYLLIVAALGVTGYSIWKSFHLRDRSQRVQNHVPAAKILYGSLALLLCSLLITYLTGSSEPMKINGVPYTSTFWLKISDMFIYTTGILMAVAIGAVIFGMSGWARKHSSVK